LTILESPKQSSNGSFAMAGGLVLTKIFRPMAKLYKGGLAIVSDSLIS
jgi:hypothetical protein